MTHSLILHSGALCCSCCSLLPPCLFFSVSFPLTCSLYTSLSSTTRTKLCLHSPAALEPCLRPWFEMALLRHPCLESALCTILAQRFASPEMPAREWRRACEDVLLHPPPGYDEKNAKNCATNSCISPDGTKKTSKSSKIKCCSSDGNGKTSNNNNSSSGCSGGGGGSSSQNSSCENLAFVAVESLKATASMESFSAMAALAEARANEWPPVEGEWQVLYYARLCKLAANAPIPL